MSADRADCLRFDRRVDERLPASGSAIGAFVDAEGAFTLTRVEVVDESAAGLGLLSPVEIPSGRRCTLCAGLVPHESGVVTRCRPEGEAFRVGLRCDRREAA